MVWFSRSWLVGGKWSEELLLYTECRLFSVPRVHCTLYALHGRVQLPMPYGCVSMCVSVTASRWRTNPRRCSRQPTTLPPSPSSPFLLSSARFRPSPQSLLSPTRALPLFSLTLLACVAAPYPEEAAVTVTSRDRWRHLSLSGWRGEGRGKGSAVTADGGGGNLKGGMKTWWEGGGGGGGEVRQPPSLCLLERVFSPPPAGEQKRGKRREGGKERKREGESEGGGREGVHSQGRFLPSQFIYIYSYIHTI